MYEVLKNRAIIKIEGVDAIKFLQSLVTNDIRENNYCYTYMLNNQGKYLFDFFVFINNIEQIFIDANINNKQLLIKHLNFYKLRSKIEIKDATDDYSIVYSHNKNFGINTLTTNRDPRYEKLGFRSLVTNEMAINTNNELYFKDKYEFTIVDGYEDLVHEKSLPVEYGAEDLNSISYSKGCYVGQEVISRTKHQGTVRKKIYKLLANENLFNILKNQEILIQDEKIGIICSYYKNIGIALIREEKYFVLQKELITVNGFNVKLSLAVWYY